MIADPEDYLNRALEADGGKGTLITYHSPEARERARSRFYGRKSAEKRRAEKLPPDDPAWGMDPWAAVRVARVGTVQLWVGCPDNEVMQILEGVAQPHGG